MDKPLVGNGGGLNFVERVSHMYDDSQKKVTKKLIIASIICVIFMIIEIIAGIVSNSLSLMTDASHLFCDLLSFALNLFSIYVSTFEGNLDMSFGYHRAEIIGALFSIFFIWALSAYILYSATFRLFQVEQVDGYIMFVTAFVSTLANIFIAFVLKVHSHGFEFIGNKSCNHNHNHGHSHHPHTNGWKSDSKNSKFININNISLEEGEKYNNDISISRINTSNCGYVSFDQYEHGDNTDPNCSKQKNKNIGNDEDVEPPNDFKIGINEYLNDKEKLNSDIYNNDKKSKKKKKNNKSNNNYDDQKDDIENINSHILPNDNDEEHILFDSLNNNLVGEKLNHNHIHDDHHTHDHSGKHNHNHSELNSISLKSAYLHAISDLLQNIGVMIASLIIWYNPKYSITDPICSIIFCFIVFSTTLSVIKEILNVLMEGTPVSINLIDIKNDILKIPGVIDVHDLHVWSLSIGKPALACHIVAHKQYSHTVLHNATVLCQKKYKILHTTVQTDYPSNITNCETQAHLKCSNLKTEKPK
ncbi:zinc transporter, putative [Plasmodium chabaudi adami]|uniref:Zinc transporter, putative n=1 Tax=Plasmodium chabaudi adami TaxID=5826 RepID=A0A1C6YN72_PLACE|nr:zinc transporter, putative [Plasmodium chabaudi adami]